MPARAPVCHPEKRHHAKGLCHDCYNEKSHIENLRKASCHPERPFHAKGLCAECYRHEWYAANKERLAPRRKERYISHKAEDLASARERRLRYPERAKLISRKKDLKCKYGITLEEFDVLLASQGGACAVCAGVEGLCVDHSHTTDEVRGILCRNCNFALGLLHDDMERIYKLAAYLSKTEEEN